SRAHRFRARADRQRGREGGTTGAVPRADGQAGTGLGSAASRDGVALHRVLVPGDAAAGSVGDQNVAVLDLDGLSHDGHRPVHVLEPVRGGRHREEMRAVLGKRWLDISMPYAWVMAAARSQPVTPPIRCRSGIT